MRPQQIYVPISHDAILTQVWPGLHPATTIKGSGCSRPGIRDDHYQYKIHDEECPWRKRDIARACQLTVILSRYPFGQIYTVHFVFMKMNGGNTASLYHLRTFNIRYSRSWTYNKHPKSPLNARYGSSTSKVLLSLHRLLYLLRFTIR